MKKRIPGDQMTTQELINQCRTYGGKIEEITDIGIKFVCVNGHESTFTKRQMYGKISKSRYIKCKRNCLSTKNRIDTEKTCRELLPQMFGISFEKIHPDWLKNWTGKNLELDFYNDQYKIAFEYQEAHHYRQTNFCDHETVKKHDLIKITRCKENGVTLFCIKDCRDKSLLASRIWRITKDHLPNGLKFAQEYIDFPRRKIKRSVSFEEKSQKRYQMRKYSH